MLSFRLPFLLLLAPVFAAPLSAQFFVTVQESGQVVPATNGGAIVFNAPGARQSVVATVTLTNTGSSAAVFSAPSSILGSANFSGTAPPITLSPAQSFSFPLTYTPPDSMQELAQFSWSYNSVANSGTNSGQTTGSGVVTFTLIGNAPNLTVGQINSSNNFVIVPAGGTVQFQDTPVNSGTLAPIAISNPGSGPVTINSITTSGTGFQVQGVPLLPLILAAGSQLNLSIAFTPTSTGTQTGTLQIDSSSGGYAAQLAGKSVSSFLTYQVIQGGTSTPVSPNQTITFPSTAVGAKSSLVLQFQSAAAMAAVLSNISLSGAGFSVTDVPFLPTTLQPQQISVLTLTFTPSQPGQYTGRLSIGNDAFLLSAVGSGPMLQFTYQTGGATVPVVSGGVISFPPIAVGQTETLQFSSLNTGTSVAPEVSIGVLTNSGAFQVSNLPALPAQIPPGGTSTFSISFSPQNTGQSTTSLIIDNQTFTLSGFASAPPSLPTYHFTGASGAQLPFQQPFIGLSLDATYPITLNGTLTLTIASASFFSDPAVLFSSGSRQVSFTIPANTLQAVFPNGATQIRLQTGTVAGTITIKPDFVVGTVNGSDITPANPVQVQLTIAAAAPTILSASLGARTNISFTITLTGYSTTRFLDHLNVQIVPAAGSSLNTVSTTIDVSAAARAWFQTATSQGLGGQFTLDIPFALGNGGTVSAGTDLTKSIASVSIVAVNDAGSSTAIQVTLP